MPKDRFRLMRPSTRAFVEEARRTPGYSVFDWLHGYVYARWPYLYIGLATGEHRFSPLFSFVVRVLSAVFPALRAEPAKAGEIAFADTYHGKVVPLESAKRLVAVQEDIRLTDLEHVIPYARAKDIVLKNPDHIVVLDCPCRAGRPEPCEPLDVCLIVGEPMASFIAEHHPSRSRWITGTEAQDILRAEHERGHVHHAFFKDAMLGRFYAICNCCACCCGAIQAHQNGVPMLCSSGYVSAVDVERCVGCGRCAGFCQFEALSVRNGAATVDAALCMGCGACVSKCDQGALSLVREPSRGEPLEIQVLLAQAAGEAARS